MKDEVFKENIAAVADFQFGEKVASVFDNMLVRSVPFYVEMQRMIAEMDTDFQFDPDVVRAVRGGCFPAPACPSPF